jgi:hypothetical protein
MPDIINIPTCLLVVLALAGDHLFQASWLSRRR